MNKGLEELLNPYGVNLPCLREQECEYTYTETQKIIIEKELKEKQEQDEILTHYNLSSKDLEEACKNLKTIKNGDFGLFFEDYEKQKKALEIIKEKKVNTSLLFNTKNHWDYNDYVSRSQIYLHSSSKCLAQEEYDLLKEVLL